MGRCADYILKSRNGLLRILFIPPWKKLERTVREFDLPIRPYVELNLIIRKNDVKHLLGYPFYIDCGWLLLQFRIMPMGQCRWSVENTKSRGMKLINSPTVISTDHSNRIFDGVRIHWSVDLVPAVAVIMTNHRKCYLVIGCSIQVVSCFVCSTIKIFLFIGQK